VVIAITGFFSVVYVVLDGAAVVLRRHGLGTIIAREAA
jgi:hypothetical protein